MINAQLKTTTFTILASLVFAGSVQPKDYINSTPDSLNIPTEISLVNSAICNNNSPEPVKVADKLPNNEVYYKKVSNILSNIKELPVKPLTINIDKIDVKKDPKDEASNIKTLTKGTVVNVLKEDGDWLFINNGTSTGYVKKEVLTGTNKENLVQKEVDQKEELKSEPKEEIKTATVIGTSLNVRKEPNMDSSKIDTLKLGQKVSVSKQSGEWYFITYNSITGYVNGKYLDFTNKPIVEKQAPSEKTTATVTGTVLNIRKTASLKGEVIGKLYENNKVNVISTSDEWVEISTTDGITGFIYKTYTSLGTPPSNEPVAASSQGQAIADYAKKFVGIPYSYGGTSLSKGVDCSGFTQQIMTHFGYKLDRSSGSQVNDGKRISKSQLLPGDLVFYGYSGSVSHVGIYIGNDKIIHSSTPRTGVIISNVNLSIPYICATRILD